MFGPDIFANGDAEFFPAQVKWFHPAGRFKISVFIEDIVSGQERFVRRANRFTRFKQGGGIVKWFTAAFIPIDETDEQGGGPHPRVKAFENLKILGNKARFEDEVLRWVPGNGQLGCQNQFRASRGESLISARDLVKITAQIPNRRIELSKTDLHGALRRVGATAHAAILFCSSQGRYGWITARCL